MVPPFLPLTTRDGGVVPTFRPLPTTKNIDFKNNFQTENQEETAPGNISMTNRQQSLVDEPEQLDYEEEIDMGKKETLPETVTSSIEDSSKKDGKRQRDRSREVDTFFLNQ